MGLDTSHGCWNGAYSSFGMFRREIARALGVNLDSMIGFGGETEWSTLPPDALHVLLTHSDCEGEIALADQIPLAERLEAIADLLPPPVSLGRDWRLAARKFAAGLRHAHDLGEVVDFH